MLTETRKTVRDGCIVGHVSTVGENNKLPKGRNELLSVSAI